ncbi:hypothetical protein D0T50_04640 [Bacteroides sp. 214]|uniref:RHS repeat protein n=1 Tax=Bacteroides sp. 214 TaxID=2302935 RepID=UPI0013D2200E|nr:RHS repeat domain-containing protein [Bacteroides sp. 214]NDW12178.1 hypothetical protein [Bacteroides sp. 214]
MRNILKYTIVFIGCLSTCVMIAQTTSGYTPELPELLPQSPQVAAFARYGEYPVSKATGVVQIDIPLYEIKAADITIPISISYHASGIKVEDVATPVGLGWSLNTGGVISRSIYGAVDKQGYTNNHVKSVQHVAELMGNKNVDITRTWRRWGIADETDSQSDRYVYNFNGKSGVFRYNSQNNEIVTIPYAPLIIEATTSGFKIKNTDGLIYHFECIEFRYSNDIAHTAAWYVTKIESQLTGSVVNFKYKTGTGYIENIPSTVRKRGTEYYSTSYNIYEDKVWGIQSTPYVLEEYLNLGRVSYLPQLVEEITWNNNKISFDYSTDRLDKYKDRLNKIEISSTQGVVKTVEFSNNSYWGNSVKNYRMRLDNIKIKGNLNTISEKYQFNYNTIPLPNYHRYTLDGDRIYCREDYWGYYNGIPTQPIPAFYFIPNEYALFGGGVNRNPNKDYMQACILNEIIYPTGGSTVFEYETNKMGGGYDYPGPDYVGGLRIKSIISKTNGKETRKTYEYEGFPTQMIQSDMFQYKQDRIYSFLNRRVPQIFWAEWQITTSIPIYSITGWHSSPVFYNVVTEYAGTPIMNTGKTVSKYMMNFRDAAQFPEYAPDIYDQNINRFWSPWYNYDQGLLEPLLTSEEVFERNGDSYNLKKETQNEYIVVDKGQITCGVRLSFRNDWALHAGEDPIHTYPFNLNFPYDSVDDFFVDDLEYYDLIAYRYFHLLHETKTIEHTAEGTVSTTMNYTYDTNHRLLSPIKTVLTNSNNISIEETTTHPFNMTGAPYTEMTQKNIIEPVVNKTRLSNGSSMSIQTNYRKENALYLLDGIQAGSDGNIMENRISYHNYDGYANPIYVTKDDATNIVYLWSYKGQYPIAEIRNATYTNVNNVMSSVFSVANINALSALTTPNETKLKDGSLQRALPNALVTTYTYKPLVGVTSVTDPRGITTYYTYDAMGRLKETYMMGTNGKEVLEAYEYNYANSSN